jgi:hypothetical protein
MVGRPRFLHRAGYSALLYDSRAHGESGGDAITFGHLEAKTRARRLGLRDHWRPGNASA